MPRGRLVESAGKWFDTHLGRMLDALQEAGELDNTIVVVTADNGMPFPRVKGHIFEDACHLPFAVRWGAVGKAGRVVAEPATPLAAIFPPGREPMPGERLRRRGPGSCYETGEPCRPHH